MHRCQRYQKLYINNYGKELPVSNLTIKGALGEKTRVKKQVLLECDIGGAQITQVCLVVKKLSNPLILGNDFFLKNEVYLDSATKKVTLQKLDLSINLTNTEVACYRLKQVMNDNSSENQKQMQYLLG